MHLGSGFAGQKQRAALTISAARNAGVNAGVNTDIDGEFRPKESGYDIGADEFGQQWDIYLPLVVKN